MSNLAFRRPLGADPYTITVADLDDALRTYIRHGHAYMAASVDGKQIEAAQHMRSLNVALAQYHELRADALPEILTAHLQHRHTIAA